MNFANRINFRLISIIAILSLLVGYPVYALVNERISQGVHRNGDHLDVDLKKLGNFRFDDMHGSLSDVPAFGRNLDGKVVALEGFIAPTSEASDEITRFQFVFNVNTCCIVGPPQVQERVFASMPAGQTIRYTNQEIRIVGTLHVVLSKDSTTGKILTVYTMDVKRAEAL